MSYNSAAAVGGVLAKAGQNAGALEHSNQQLGDEASAFDVWTHSYDGMAERMREFAGDPVGALQQYDSNLDAAVEAGLTGDWQSGSFSAVGDSIAAQAEGLGDMVAAVGEAEGALATVGATFALLTGVEQMLSTLVSVIPFPSLPAIRIMDMDVGLPHAHSHPPNLVPPAPPVPLPSTGPIIPIPILSGAARTLINGMPAARCGDMGLGIWCGGYFPMYEVFLGSSSVWIEGARAGRVAVDITKHCVFTSPKPSDPPLGPMVGFTVSASTNVLIGGVPMPSLLSLAMGAAIKGTMKGLGKAARGFDRATRGLRQRMFRNMKSSFLKCAILRAEPVNILTGSVTVEQDDFTLPGRISIDWVRTYSSDSARAGSCGYGWETPADIRLEIYPDGTVSFRHPTIGPAWFAGLPAPSDSAGVLELTDGARLADNAHEYVVRTKEERLFHFPKHAAFMTANGTREYPIGNIADPWGNWFAFERVSGRLTAVADSSGRRVEVVSDSGRITELRLSGPSPVEWNTIVRYEYDAAGDLRAVVDAMGNAHRFEYADHHIVRHTDRRGLSFHYEYDGQTPDAWRVVHAWGDGGLYDYHFAYDHVLNQRRITDSFAHVTVITLDERGLPIVELDPLGGRTMFEYDDAGRTTAVVDQDGHRTAYTYDERGNLVQLTHADGTSIVTEFNDDDRPVRVIDPNGGVWHHEWDSRGLLVAETTPIGHTSRFEFDAMGQLRAFVNPRGARTELNFDTGANVTVLEDPFGHRTLFDYDGLGNVIAVTDPLGRQTRYQYDRKSRLTSIRTPSGATISCAYDAADNLVQYIDENGAATRLEYTGLGEVARRVDPDGSTVQYHYDTEERLIGITNQRGQTYRFVRDPLGRIVEEIDYWTQSRRYRYSPGGAIQETIDALGRLVRYRSDPVGNIIGKLLPDPDDGPSSFAEIFQYDAIGNVVSAANPFGRVERVYDGEGRLLEEKQGSNVTIRNVYDEVGNRIRRVTERRTGNGYHRQSVAYGYDLLDRPIEIAVDGRPPIRLLRNQSGAIVSEQLAPALHREVDYTLDGYVARQRVRAGHTTVVDLAYDYEPGGNLRQRRDARYGLDVYTYDLLGQITRHLDPSGTVKQYLADPAGDRLVTGISEEPVRAFPADGVARSAPLAKGQAFSSTSTSANEWRRDGEYEGVLYRFDRAGNLVYRRDDQGELTLRWDANQRLVESRLGGTSTRYRYDAFGRRIEKATGGARTTFLWDEDTLIGDLKHEDGSVPGKAVGPVRDWIHYPETFEPLIMVVSNGEGPAVFLSHNEPNGSPTCLTNRLGHVVWAASFSVTGGLETPHVSVVDNPLRLQGQYYDSETRLHYNRYRYFSPHVGMFVSADPLGQAEGENDYAFGRNTLAWIDPLGLVCKRIGQYFAGLAARIRAAFGPFKNWLRIGPSYSKGGAFKVSRSVRWGASPAKGGKYVNQIGNSVLRSFNQWLRNRRIPLPGWRFRDPGHIHLKK